VGRLRVFLVALAAALATALAGCGGEGDGGAPADGAEMAPATAALFVAINTDFEGDQWQAAEELVTQFPASEDAIASFREELENDGLDFEQDVKPALGSEVDIVALTVEDLEQEALVGLTRPSDREKFEQLAEQGDEPFVYEFVDDWAVFAQDEATIDAFLEARDGDSLAEAERFAETTGGLPEEALATVYVSGEALTEEYEAAATPEDREVVECALGDGGIPSMAFSLGAEDDGARLSGAIVAPNLATPEEAGSELVDEVAGDALVFVSVRGLGEQLRELFRCMRGANEEFNDGLAQAELGLGVSIEEDILPLFGEETAIVVYPPPEGAEPVSPAIPFAIPTAAFVTQVEDEERALATADRIAERVTSLADATEVEVLDIAGVEARRVATGGPVDVFFAVFDGKLVVATSPEGIEAAQGDDARLTDDEAFSGAREAAGAPDETTGISYADVADGIDYFLELYESGESEAIPPDVRGNLEPLRSLFFWSETDDDRYTFEGFLEIE
jgi:Protein of unknown function (DUF3352)